MGLIAGLFHLLLNLAFLLFRFLIVIVVIVIIILLLRRKKKPVHQTTPPRQQKPHFDGPVVTVDYEEVESNQREESP